MAGHCWDAQNHSEQSPVANTAANHARHLPPIPSEEEAKMSRSIETSRKSPNSPPSWRKDPGSAYNRQRFPAWPAFGTHTTGRLAALFTAKPLYSLLCSDIRRGYARSIDRVLHLKKQSRFLCAAATLVLLPTGWLSSPFRVEFIVRLCSFAPPLVWGVRSALAGLGLGECLAWKKKWAQRPVCPPIRRQRAETSAYPPHYTPARKSTLAPGAGERSVRAAVRSRQDAGGTRQSE